MEADVVEEDEYRRPVMQQGGDVGGLADRAQMPEFQHGFKRESYPYLAFARKHNLDYGLVSARVDVWRRSPKTQDMTPLESKAVAFFNCISHLNLYAELYDIWRSL